jgi:chorismate synthase
MEVIGGPLFAVAGAGESHGPGVVTIVMGCPPGLRISRCQIQEYLDRRRPGSTKHGTTRREGDKVLLLSGLFDENLETLLGDSKVIAQVDGVEFPSRAYEEGYTTGEPIAALVLSTSGKSSDYDQFAGSKGEVRPGHTDLVKYYKSSGFTDYRGGGRSSYRSTVSDVIAGSIARVFLMEKFGTEILSSVCQVGGLKAHYTLNEHVETLQRRGESNRIELDKVALTQAKLESEELPTLDSEFAGEAAELIRRARVEGDSLGCALEVVAVNVPPLLGEPLFDSLKVRLMGSLGGLHAAQACEIGGGLEVVSRKGSQNNDPIRSQGYQANSHGGLIGGITTGMPLVVRVGFKPTSSISKPQLSVRKNLEEIDFELEKGRHDPCVGIRAGVTLESRVAIELMNSVLVHQSANIDSGNFKLF